MTKEILKQYWGYDSFRPVQEDIINAVLQGKDVLALLPTGGGKSVCFQIPALAKEGLCSIRLAFTQFQDTADTRSVSREKTECKEWTGVDAKGETVVECPISVRRARLMMKCLSRSCKFRTC